MRVFQFGVDKVVGYLVNFCVIAVEAILLMASLQWAAQDQTPFDAIPASEPLVAAASLDPALIEREQTDPAAPGRAIFDQNRDADAVLSLAGMTLDRFTRLDIFDNRVEHLTDADMERVANAGLRVDGQPLTLDQRQALLAYLLAEKQATNELADDENANKEEAFREGTVFYEDDVLYLEDPYLATIYVFGFFLIALMALFAALRQSIRDFIFQIGQALLLGAATTVCLVYAYVYNYNHSPGYALMSPLFSVIQHYAVMLAAPSLLVAFAFYWLGRGLKRFGKELALAVMALMVCGEVIVVLRQVEPKVLALFAVVFLAALTLWAFCLENGDMGFVAVSRILRRRPPQPASGQPAPGQPAPGYPAPGYPAVAGYGPPIYPTASGVVLAPKRKSPALGLGSLATVAIAGAIMCWMFYSFGLHTAQVQGLDVCEVPLAAGEPTAAAKSQATWEALTALLFGLAGLVGWVNSIIAIATNRGRGAGVAGLVIGLGALGAMIAAITLGIMAAC
ncbi:MAG: hypothetical protein LBD70_00290 [Bifidobacteriaceae bacterium]|jgi:hypothetical protein|nr:hypothetical protein [Bifidobacteriaceae bacterium]